MRHILLIASIVFSVLLTVLPGHAQSRLTAPLAPNASPLRSTSSQNEPTPPIRPAVAAELLIEDVPLPGDVSVSNPQDVAENLRRFSGAWVGVWGGQLRHILVVENVMAGGSANVVYAVGDNPAANVRRQWHRHKATISGNTLRIERFATYELTGNGKLDATYQAGNGRARATMSRIELADLTRPGAIAWGLPNIEFLDTALKENGKPIRLETVLVKPSGSGPFPLAVFNHGSTGTGKDPGLFAQTWWSPDIANFLVDRGWMVAFPQRRGRGKSEGLYDEGFGPDRTQGYTCDSKLSLAGADRALADIEAAVDVLHRRPDVAPKPILMGGVSRGGVLSIAYAGKHPQQVAGVVNFVGGWMGQWCSNASYINGSLFQMGGVFPHPTIWLYGNHDSTYGLEHSRANFAAFQKAAGKGSFAEFDLPGTTNGHFIHVYPQLWTDTLAKYLDTLEADAPGAARSPLLVRAQQQTKPTIGWLDVWPWGPLPEFAEGLRQGLAEVGFSEGRDVTVEYRTADGHPERLSALAADMVRRRPAAILAPQGITALAAKAATPDIPIIFIAGNDPIELGLVASLNRPGGNLTGLANLGAEIAEKRLELLHKAVPAIETIAMLVGPADSPYNQAETRQTQSAASALGLRLLVYNVTADTEITPVFATLVEHQAGAILVGGDVTLAAKLDQILSQAARFALPTMSTHSSIVRAGGLLSYAADNSDVFRQMGAYVGRILKGEKPADLPVVQPTKFEFAINLKTAKALGLTIPRTLLVAADEVIE